MYCLLNPFLGDKFPKTRIFIEGGEAFAGFGEFCSMLRFFLG